MIRLNTHAPFAEGTCDVCHEDPKQTAAGMRAGARERCLGCHEPRKGGHPADVGESCVSCHTPHTTSGNALMKASEKIVCISCHSEIGLRQESAEETHPELEKGQHCSVCHELHTGKTRFYLKQAEPLAMCSTCHQGHSEFAHPMGRGVLDRSRRGRTVDCLSCHDPHGTPFPRLLLADPRRDLCIRCHTDSMMNRP
jgi:predicted CXXCH cytochrome family protein